MTMRDLLTRAAAWLVERVTVPRWVLVVLVLLALVATTTRAQSVTMTPQADSAYRLFVTYRTANGSAVSSREVRVTATAPCRVAPVPGTTRGRYVYVLASGPGFCTVRGEATVGGVTYAAERAVVAVARIRVSDALIVQGMTMAGSIKRANGHGVDSLVASLGWQLPAEGPDSMTVVVRHPFDADLSSRATFRAPPWLTGFRFAVPVPSTAIGTEVEAVGCVVLYRDGVPHPQACASDTVAIPRAAEDMTVVAVRLCPAEVTVPAGGVQKFCALVVFRDAEAVPSWDRGEAACAAWQRPAVSAERQAVADQLRYGASLGTVDARGVWTAPASGTGVVWAEVGSVRSQAGSCPNG